MILHCVYKKLRLRNTLLNKAIVIKHPGKILRIFYKRVVHKHRTIYLLDLDLKFKIAKNHTHSLALIKIL